MTRHRRRDVGVMRLFVDVCDDGVPEGVARDALHVHLLADVAHQRAMLGIGQGLRAAKEKVMPAYRPRCRVFDVRSGNLRDSYVAFAKQCLGISYNGKVARWMGDIAANADDIRNKPVFRLNHPI